MKILFCFTDKEKETECVDAQNLLSFLHPKERCIRVELWQRSRANTLSPENPTVRSHGNLYYFSFPSSVPVGELQSLFLMTNLIIRASSVVSGFLRELFVFSDVCWIITLDVGLKPSLSPWSCSWHTTRLRWGVADYYFVYSIYTIYKITILPGRTCL